MSIDGEFWSTFRRRQCVGGKGAPTCSRKAAATTVSLSKWVNERSPALGEILSAHDVARLTRRHGWLLRTQTLVGRLPREQRFHGRAIGWAKRDVLKWLAEHSRFGRVPARRCRRHFARARDRRGPCSALRPGGES